MPLGIVPRASRAAILESRTRRAYISVTHVLEPPRKHLGACNSWSIGESSFLERDGERERERERKGDHLGEAPTGSTDRRHKRSEIADVRWMILAEYPALNDLLHASRRNGTYDARSLFNDQPRRIYDFYPVAVDSTLLKRHRLIIASRWIWEIDKCPLWARGIVSRSCMTSAKFFSRKEWEIAVGWQGNSPHFLVC